jgi:ribosomal protein L7/L12
MNRLVANASYQVVRQRDAIHRPLLSIYRLQSSESPEPHTEDSPPISFLYPKSQALFEKITTTLSRDDVLKVATETGNILGRPMRQNEFYYVGFGGGGKKRDAASDEQAAEAAPVKTTVDLKLVGYDDKMKIKIIKEVRAIAGLGLKEAKELVEGAPKTIQKNLKPEAAEELKAKLEELGAAIELV